MKGIGSAALVLVLASGAASAGPNLNPGGGSPEAITSGIGRSTSVYSDDTLTLAAIPAFPSTVTVASVGIPTKYKSKKNFLIVQTDVQETCSGDATASAVSVGGVFAFPETGGASNIDCTSGAGYQHLSRTWFLLPESLGGAPVAPLSTVDLVLTSGAGTAQTGSEVSMTVLSTK